MPFPKLAGAVIRVAEKVKRERVDRKQQVLGSVLCTDCYT
jgi:hypothetical protein